MGVEVLFQSTVVACDSAQRLLKLALGGTIKYDRLLLATGASPKSLIVPGHLLKVRPARVCAVCWCAAFAGCIRLMPGLCVLVGSRAWRLRFLTLLAWCALLPLRLLCSERVRAADADGRAGALGRADLRQSEARPHRRLRVRICFLLCAMLASTMCTTTSSSS